MVEILLIIGYEKPTDIYSRGADLCGTLDNYCDYYYLTMLVIYEHFGHVLL